LGGYKEQKESSKAAETKIGEIEGWQAGKMRRGEMKRTKASRTSGSGSGEAALAVGSSESSGPPDMKNT
jgi:hypothetical protein